MTHSAPTPAHTSRHTPTHDRATPQAARRTWSRAALMYPLRARPLVAATLLLCGTTLQASGAWGGLAQQAWAGPSPASLPAAT
ncbi:MAG: hypothetical protein ABF946_12760, partial [Acetobacter papayae]